MLNLPVSLFSNPLESVEELPVPLRAFDLSPASFQQNACVFFTTMAMHIRKHVPLKIDSICLECSVSTGALPSYQTSMFSFQNYLFAIDIAHLLREIA